MKHVALLYKVFTDRPPEPAFWGLWRFTWSVWWRLAIINVAAWFLIKWITYAFLTPTVKGTMM